MKKVERIINKIIELYAFGCMLFVTIISWLIIIFGGSVSITINLLESFEAMKNIINHLI